MYEGVHVHGVQFYFKERLQYSAEGVFTHLFIVRNASIIITGSAAISGHWKAVFTVN